MPGALLQFEVADCNNFRKRTGVTLEKFDSETYWYTYNDYSVYGKICYETLDQKGISKYLRNVTPVFEAYPFLLLPFGNCFS